MQNFHVADTEHLGLKGAHRHVFTADVKYIILLRTLVYNVFIAHEG